MQKFSETLIQGQLTHIKRIYNNEKHNNTSVSFIVERQSDDGKFKHQYLINAFSKGPDDIFSIESFVGTPVSCSCYVNGRRRDTTKGDFYNVELALFKIEASYE